MKSDFAHDNSYRQIHLGDSLSMLFSFRYPQKTEHQSFRTLLSLSTLKMFCVYTEEKNWTYFGQRQLYRQFPQWYSNVLCYLCDYVRQMLAFEFEFKDHRFYLDTVCNMLTKQTKSILHFPLLTFGSSSALWVVGFKSSIVV